MTWRGVSVPALVILALAVLMAAPTAYAIGEGDWRSARAFGYSAGLTGAAAGALALAHRGRALRAGGRAELLAYIWVFTAGPLAAALPVYLAAPAMGIEGALFDMVGALTTTGASVLRDPADAPSTVALWRALTAWFGGFATLAAALAILAPRNLGGAELQLTSHGGSVGRLGGAPSWTGATDREVAGSRLARAIATVGPIYLALTATLALMFAVSGMPDFIAICRAMSVMSTSGVEVRNDGFRVGAGWGVEAAAAAVMIVAASRHFFVGGPVQARLMRFGGDPELRLLCLAVSLATTFLFLRHWIGAIEVEAATSTVEALAALWGALFTVVSFITTTGFVSDSWETARNWSGLSNPGLLLLGLATLGGGVASTAGGIKLLRAFALYRHGLDEMQRLASPNSVARRHEARTSIRREGMTLAWVFVMLFFFSVAATVLALGAAGTPLDRAIAAAIAALSNTGPAFQLATDNPDGYGALTPRARSILCVAMIVGRVETLAVVALFNPAYWRR